MASDYSSSSSTATYDDFVVGAERGLFGAGTKFTSKLRVESGHRENFPSPPVARKPEDKDLLSGEDVAKSKKNEQLLTEFSLLVTNFNYRVNLLHAVAKIQFVLAFRANTYSEILSGSPKLKVPSRLLSVFLAFMDLVQSLNIDPLRFSIMKLEGIQTVPSSEPLRGHMDVILEQSRVTGATGRLLVRALTQIAPNRRNLLDRTKASIKLICDCAQILGVPQKGDARHRVLTSDEFSDALVEAYEHLAFALIEPPFEDRSKDQCFKELEV